MNEKRGMLQPDSAPPVEEIQEQQGGKWKDGRGKN